MQNQPLNQPQSGYPPQPWQQQPNTGYPPQFQAQPQYGPPAAYQQASGIRPVRMKVKVACILCFALAAMLGMAGIPGLLPIAGIALLAAFVLVFLI